MRLPTGPSFGGNDQMVNIGVQSEAQAQQRYNFLLERYIL